jgi:hypothetical protein
VQRPHTPLVIRQTGITIPGNGEEKEPNNSEPPEQSCQCRCTEKNHFAWPDPPDLFDPQAEMQPIAPLARAFTTFEDVFSQQKVF